MLRRPRGCSRQRSGAGSSLRGNGKPRNSHAATHNRTLKDYVATIEAWIVGHLRAADVHLRMRTHNFESFLRAGRYVTQFEGATSGGLQNASVRILLEETVLRVPASSRPADRPIYGYMSCSDEGGVIQQYGEVVMILRPQVRNRATFVVGDSLDNAFHYGAAGPCYAPRPISRPSALALGLEDPLVAASPADVAPHHGYWEAQILGGIRAEDVSEAVFTLATGPSAAAASLMSGLGIQWRTTSGVGP
jgi:Protein of unknown function (DUF3626)